MSQVRGYQNRFRPNKGTKHDIAICVSISPNSILSVFIPPEHRTPVVTEFQGLAFAEHFSQVTRRVMKIVRKGSIVDRAYKALQNLGKVGFGHHLSFEHRFATE